MTFSCAFPELVFSFSFTLMVSGAQQCGIHNDLPCLAALTVAFEPHKKILQDKNIARNVSVAEAQVFLVQQPDG